MNEQSKTVVISYVNIILTKIAICIDPQARSVRLDLETPIEREVDWSSSCLDFDTAERTFFSAEVKINIGQLEFSLSCCCHSVKAVIQFLR